jgi:hypothetical protein
MTEGQKTEIQTTQLQGIPPLSFADADNILSHKGSFMDDIRAVYAKYSVEWQTNKSLMEWFHFYKEHFGLELNFTGLNILERHEGFDRLIVVAQGVTIQQAYDRCKKLFGVWKYTDKDLDSAIPTNDRDPKNGTYAIWVRDTVEADEQFKNKSANDLKSEQHVGITVLERLIYELKYFKETGKHLDIDNWTLCSGSRNAGGGVPCVRWRRGDSTVRVDWYGRGLRGPSLRSREIVS